MVGEVTWGGKEAERYRGMMIIVMMIVIVIVVGVRSMPPTRESEGACASAMTSCTGIEC